MRVAGRQHGTARLHLDLRLELPTGLSRVVNTLGLLGERHGQARHGQGALGQAAGQLGRRGVQAGRVLHRGPFRRVVLLLVLLLACNLDRLRGRRHSACTYSNEVIGQLEQQCGKQIDGHNLYHVLDLLDCVINGFQLFLYSKVLMPFIIW